MVGVLIRLKLDVLRRSYGGGRSALTIAGATVGLVLAGATLIVGSRDAAGDVLCLAFAMWTVGWIVGPMVTGGDTSLRPQYFALLPIPMRRLATGLFGAAFVGVPAVVTLAAFGALVLHGFRLGFGPGLVAIPAALLQLAVVVLLSKNSAAGSPRSRKPVPAGRSRRLCWFRGVFHDSRTARALHSRPADRPALATTAGSAGALAPHWLGDQRRRRCRGWRCARHDFRTGRPGRAGRRPAFRVGPAAAPYAGAVGERVWPYTPDGPRAPGSPRWWGRNCTRTRETPSAAGSCGWRSGPVFSCVC
ncbi:hypothetical protein [Fodinicola feengrottensis]|uniref:hypothetical protein n=1 Tax=Fodinicola feengrottensis TaxID=435914 RepID=UPI0013D225E0|nr:hypothetical protein [Fodinicola feengrottensis]